MSTTPPATSTWSKEVDKLKNRLSVLSQSSLEVEDQEKLKGIKTNEPDISGKDGRTPSPGTYKNERTMDLGSGSASSSSSGTTRRPPSRTQPRERVDQHRRAKNEVFEESEFVTAKRREEEEVNGGVTYDCESCLAYLLRRSTRDSRLTIYLARLCYELSSLLLWNPYASFDSHSSVGSGRSWGRVPGCHPARESSTLLQSPLPNEESDPQTDSNLPLACTSRRSIGLRQTRCPLGRLSCNHQLARIVSVAQKVVVHRGSFG